MPAAVGWAISGTPEATDTDSDDALIMLTNDAPGFFPLGTTTFMWTAVDVAGNSATCTQKITVVDLSPPTLLCRQGSTIVTCTDPNGALVEFPTSASDNCGDENITLVCVPPSGPVFPPEVTTVTCTETDAAGNASTCSFDVDVFCGGFVLPGDCDANGTLDLTDAICILSILFSDTSRLPPCGDWSIRDPANVGLLSWNGTSDVDLASAVALLNFKFLGGLPHVLGRECAPIPDCPELCVP